MVCRRGENPVDFAQSVLGGIPVEEKKHGGNAVATLSHWGLFDFAQNWSKRR